MKNHSFNNNVSTVKKAKGIYLYTYDNKKIIDLSHNENIIGYSHKKITHNLKNAISNNLYSGFKTVYHNRLINIFKPYLEDYDLMYTYSVEDFLLKYLLIRCKNDNKNYQYLSDSKPMTDYIAKNSFLTPVNNIDLKENLIKIEDCAYNYMSNKVQNDADIQNGFFYPSVKLFEIKSDIVILPSFLSGNFNFTLLLIKKSIDFRELISSNIYTLPILYTINSVTHYHLIKKIELETQEMDFTYNDDYTGNKRIFLINNFSNPDELLKKAFSLLKNGIFINTEPPYYNYLPLIMEEHQINYLRKKGNILC